MTIRPEPLPEQTRAGLPAYEHVLDRLGELLFEADELLDVVRSPEAKSVWWVEQHIQHVYDEVNALMKKMCD